MRPDFTKHGLVVVLVLWAVLPASAGQLGSSSAGTNQEKVVLRAGYPAGVVDRGVLEDMRISLEVWGTNVARRASHRITRVEAAVFDENADFLVALRRKEIDLMVLSTTDYLGFEETTLMEPFYVGLTDGKVGQEFVILVRRDNDVDSVHQLKNGAISIDEGIVGRLPRIWLDVFLWKKGISDVTVFFKEINGEPKTSKAVLPVFFGTVDACVTNLRAFRTLAEMNPQLERELAILDISPPLLRGIFVFRKDLDEDIKADIIVALQIFHEDPDGQQILMLMKEETLLPFKPEYLESVKTLLEEYEQIQQVKTGDNRRE